MVSTNQGTWEDGALKEQGDNSTGSLLAGQGKDTSHPLNNMLVANCLFKNSPFADIVLRGLVTDFLSVSNDFLFRTDGTNGGYNGNITSPSSTTADWPKNSLGIYVKAGGIVNLDLIACYFNGHVNSTNTDPSCCAVGILWCQPAYSGTNGIADGNWFAARNMITN